MVMTAREILEKDIQKLYLGNLNTVEFDLKLPVRGANGSKITWYSDNELFLRSDGSVTRPMNGIGDRKVHLRGVFCYQHEKMEKVYEVHILEEPSEVKIVEVLPLERKIEVGVKSELPQAVVIKGDNGHFFSRQVDWEGGNEQIFNVCGEYLLDGKVKEEEISAKLKLCVVEKADIEQWKKKSAKVKSLDMGETKLQRESVFYDALKAGTEYFKAIDLDEMLYNFRITAGLDTKNAGTMSGWDSPDCLLRGHTTGHYLSALALCYRETKDKEIYDRLDYMVRELGKCQKVFGETTGYHKGYLGAYSEEQFDLLEAGAKYPDIWAPYYTLHKLLAGFLDAWQYADMENALEIAKEIGFWIYNRLSRLTKNEREKMWDTYIAGEFGGINESLAKLYEITGECEFIETAKMFDNDRLFVPMEEKKDVLEGMHANQHIPQIIGGMEIFKATGEERYYRIAKYFWEIVTGAHIYVNGGTGETEMFFEPNAEAQHLSDETAEYCASYNMLKLTKELYQFEPKSQYMDYYERCMFNHLVAGTCHGSPEEITYFYSMKPGAHKEIKFVNACCHGTGMEIQMKYTEAIYFHTDDTLYVNMFLNSSLKWKEKDLYVIQEVSETEPGNIELHFEGEGECFIKIRCPYWCDKKFEILVNHRKVIVNCGDDGYIIIKRNTEINSISVCFQCEMRVEDTSGSKKLKALAYGPYVLAAVSKERKFLKINGKTIKPEKTMGQKLAFFEQKGKGLMWKPLANIFEEQYHVYWENTE